MSLFSRTKCLDAYSMYRKYKPLDVQETYDIVYLARSKTNLPVVISEFYFTFERTQPSLMICSDFTKALP